MISAGSSLDNTEASSPAPSQNASSNDTPPRGVNETLSLQSSGTATEDPSGGVSTIVRAESMVPSACGARLAFSRKRPKRMVDGTGTATSVVSGKRAPVASSYTPFAPSTRRLSPPATTANSQCARDSSHSGSAIDQSAALSRPMRIKPSRSKRASIGWSSLAVSNSWSMYIGRVLRRHA